jgi:hypothetical protein
MATGAVAADLSSKKFYIQAALHDESSSGWIWASQPGLLARSLVKITNKRNNKSIICEYREIDQYFAKTYNQASDEKGAEGLQSDKKPIVISLWYRHALGIGSERIYEELSIDPVSSILSTIRAGSQHPDQMVRLATGLGMVGVWLGLDSIAFSLLSLFHGITITCIALSIMIVSGGIFLYLCKGVDRQV